MICTKPLNSNPVEAPSEHRQIVPGLAPWDRHPQARADAPKMGPVVGNEGSSQGGHLIAWDLGLEKFRNSAVPGWGPCEFLPRGVLRTCGLESWTPSWGAAMLLPLGGVRVSEYSRPLGIVYVGGTDFLGVETSHPYFRTAPAWIRAGELGAALAFDLKEVSCTSCFGLGHFMLDPGWVSYAATGFPKTVM